MTIAFGMKLLGQLFTFWMCLPDTFLLLPGLPHCLVHLQPHPQGLTKSKLIFITTQNTARRQIF